jgi:hypothetical protein
MSFIIGANSAVGGVLVDNSCRFNSGSSDYLERGSLGTGSTTKATFSAWFKKANLSASQDIYSLYLNNDNQVRLRLRNTGEISIYISLLNVAVLEKRSTMLLRDASAWYHVVLETDLTESADEDKYKIYINNERITSWAVNTNTSATSYDYLVAGGGSYVMHLGSNGPPDGNFYDGYMAEVVFIDGLALTPSSFGEFDEDSPTIWKPIDVSGLTFGTNGFYLDFEDSSALGNDAAGSNNFTVGNLTAIDQVTDTPVNNFSTLNPLVTGSLITLSEGNLKALGNSASDGSTTVSTLGITGGKFYWEMKVTNVVSGYPYFGIYDDFDSLVQGNLQGQADGTRAMTVWTKADTTLRTPSGNITITTPANGDIIMFAVDKDNNKFYLGVNGTWYNSGDPTTGATGTGSLADLTAGGVVMFGTHDYNASAIEVNFGNPPYANSSDAADANGYGAFEYAPPSGYLALCTKNLGSDGG